MEIINGSYRTIHFFGAGGMSEGERGILRDLERSDNDIAMYDQLQSLRQQYLNNERVLESYRQAQRERLAAYNPTITPGVYPDEVIPVDTNGYLAANAYSYLRPGYPFLGALPYAAGAYAGYGGYSGNGWQSPPTPAPPESELRTELVRGLAQQASPEYLAQATRSRDRALAMAGDSDQLRAALDLPARKKGDVTPAALNQPANQVTVTLKSGDKVRGTLVKEDKDVVVLDTGTEQVEIRRAETVSIARPKK
jgi:hypothetical protein